MNALDTRGRKAHIVMFIQKRDEDARLMEADFNQWEVAARTLTVLP